MHTSRSASRVRRAENVLESDQAQRTRAKLGVGWYGPSGLWGGWFGELLLREGELDGFLADRWYLQT